MKILIALMTDYCPLEIPRIKSFFFFSSRWWEDTWGLLENIIIYSSNSYLHKAPQIKPLQKCCFLRTDSEGVYLLHNTVYTARNKTHHAGLALIAQSVFIWLGNGYKFLAMCNLHCKGWIGIIWVGIKEEYCR